LIAAALSAVPHSAAGAVSRDAIQLELTRAWVDAARTWERILGPRTYASDIPQINFVAEVRPSHCYGLYISAGPVYCSGNNTVFVSVAEMERLSRRFGGAEPAALVFLLAHELGHHVQKITGRFRVHAKLAGEKPERLRELSLRFELEADCLAGVWASNSAGFAADANVRRSLLALVDAIGDDKVQTAANGAIDPATFTHGDSAHRKKWYRIGIDAGTTAACNVLEAASY
jgi:predicted metalloprotease